MKKSTLLSVVFWGLVLISLVLALWPEKEGVSNTSPGLPDSADIVSIKIKTNDTETRLTKSNGWLLNNDLTTDNQLVRIALVFIQDVKVRRNLEVGEKSRVEEWFQLKGASVTLSDEKGDETNMQLTSDPENSKTFGRIGNEWMELYIPGYQEFVGGIFYLSENQWRSKEMLSVSWLNLDELTFSGSRTDLNIQYENDFLMVQGVAVLDTAKMMDYISYFEQFSVNQFLDSAEILDIDSSYSFQLTDTLMIKRAGSEVTERIFFYDQKLNNFTIGSYRDDYFALSPRRTELLFRAADSFELTSQ